MRQLRGPQRPGSTERGAARLADEGGPRFRNAGMRTQPVEFHRAEGEGGASQRWIDDNLPTCPFCRSPSLWGVATGADQLALGRWYFQCSNCKAVMSTIPDTPVSALAEPVIVTKTALAVNLRIESVQRSEDEDFVGEEFPLYELQQWAEEDEG